MNEGVSVEAAAGRDRPVCTHRRRSRPAAVFAGALWLGLCACGGSTPGAHAPRLEYLPVAAENAIYVLDVRSHRLRNKIAGLGAAPVLLRVLPDRSKIYVQTLATRPAEIAVIDTASERLSHRIALQGRVCAPMLLAPDGRRLYVPTVRALQVIDTASDTVLRTQPLPAEPSALDLSPDGATLYLLFSDNRVAAYDTASGAQREAPRAAPLPL